MEQVTELNLNNVSDEQLEIMKHALGIGRKSKPYRNYYFCSDDNDWNELISKGFAKRYEAHTDGKYYYYLTFEAVKLIYGKRISKKYYDEL